MRDRNDAKLISGCLIDDAVGEAAEKAASLSAPIDWAELRILQNKARASFKLCHKGATQFDIGPSRIERCRIMKFSKGKRDNDELHFNAARTCARASAIGIT